ncbi:MAG: hypothetical protein EBR30_08075 [Cytophagia bacterium]|nr:hypothetical protein [Cytophagia bacterium]
MVKSPTMRLKSRVLYVLLLLFVFMIPLSQYVNTRLLVAVCILSLFIGDNREGVKQMLRNSWDALLYLSILVIGLFYSENLSAGLKVIESNLSFLGVPLIFSRINTFSKNNILAIGYSFILGLAVACIICLTNAWIQYQATGATHYFFFYDLTDVIGFQPTYFAYYLIFAITYLLFNMYYHLGASINLIGRILGVLFLFLMLMLTGGHTAFVSILLIFSFFILKFLIEGRNREKKIVTGLVITMLLGMFITALLNKGERSLILTDSWDRLVLWESAIEATPNSFIGVGTGDYKNTLNEYYRAHNLQKFANENYNSHNQFIQVLFSNGLLGIFSLFILVGRPLYLSIKNQHLLGILLFFPFLIYGMTEVFLGRYQGIVFFILIHQLCILQIRFEEFKGFIKPPGFATIKP